MVYTKRYKIDSPLWNSRAKALIVNWIPHCIDEINDPNLRKAASTTSSKRRKKLRGEPAGRHRGYVILQRLGPPDGGVHVHRADDRSRRAIRKSSRPRRRCARRWKTGFRRSSPPRSRTAISRPRSPSDDGQVIDGAFKHWDPPGPRGDHEGYMAGYFLESAINHYS